MRSQRLRRLLKVLGVALAAIVLVLAVTVAALFHFDIAPLRRAAVERINAALVTSFRGNVELTHVGKMRAGMVEDARLVVRDPRGREVLRLEGVRASYDVGALLHSLLRTSDPIAVTIRSLEIRDGHVLIEEGPSGQLTLAEAFEARHPSTEAGRQTRVVIERVKLGHLWVHGGLKAVPVIDGELTALRGSLASAPERFAVDIARTNFVARRVQRDVSLRGRLGGDLSFRPTMPETLALHARLSAKAGNVSAELDGSYAKERIDAELNVPETPAADVRALFPEAPLHAPIALNARVQGTLAHLAAEVEAAIGGGRIRLDAGGGLTDRRELGLTFSTERLDARAFSPTAPKTSLDARGTLRGRLLDDRGPYGEFTVETKPSTVDQLAVPAVSLQGRFSEARLVAHARIHEPGAPSDVDLAYTPGRDAGPAHLDVEGRVHAELARLTRLPVRLRGTGDVRLSAEVELPSAPAEPTLSARFNGRATGLVHPSASARALSFSGTLDGPASLAVLTLRAEASAVRIAGRRVDRAIVAANGPLATPRVDVQLEGGELPATRAHAVVSFEDGLSARALHADLRRAGTRAEADANRIVLQHGVVTIDALRVRGVGELDANARIGPRTLRVDAQARALRLDEVASLAGVQNVRGGMASFDVALRSDRAGLHGKLTTSLRDLEVDQVSGGSADADLTFDGRLVRGSLDAALGKAVSVHATSNGLRLPRETPSLRSLAEIEGDVRVRSEADLAALVHWLPADLVPVGTARGKLELDATLSSNDARHELSADIQLKTSGLMLTGRGAGRSLLTRQQALKRAPWELSGVDAVLEAKLTNHDSPSVVKLRVYDRKGNLAELDAEATLGLTDLLKHPATALRHALDAPLLAEVRIPERSIDDLPILLRPHELTGRVGMTARLSGKLGNPELTIDAAAKRLAPRNRRDAAPFDATAHVFFADSHGRAELAAIRGGNEVLLAKSQFDLLLRELLQGRDPRVHASAELRAQGFELESIPALKDRQLEGSVDGALTLVGLGEDAKLDGDVTVTKMRLGGTPVQELSVSLHAGGGRVHSGILLLHGDGHALAKVDAGLLWGRRLVPEIDESRPLVARLKAKSLRAGILLPLVDQSVAKLDGRVDADVRAELGGGRQRLDGGVVLREGVVQVPAIGQELRSIRARVDLHPDGTIIIHDVSARGVVGRVRAAAAMRMQGMRLASARAKVVVDKGEKIPLTVQGVSVGEAWGALDIEMRSLSPKLTRVDVKVPSFHLELPQRARQKVQSLEPADRVVVGARQANGEFMALPLQPLEEATSDEEEPSELRVVVKLGKDVWVRQGTQLRVKLEGAIALRIREEQTVQGQIQLARGRIDVQGKIFEIVNGTVSFEGDASNPTIVATARWESPDGITVYADFTGPVKSGTLRLRSEPALSQDEILALLLFGTPDGSFGSGQSGEGGKAATAVALGGGVATKGLNAGIASLTDLDIQTRIDTSGQSPRPELAFQMSRRVTAEVAYSLAEPAPGKPPDRTFFILDFRLGRRWSLSTTFGDRGSSLLDLVWRYRY